jgi:hypothetical protein
VFFVCAFIVVDNNTVIAIIIFNNDFFILYDFSIQKEFFLNDFLK